MSLSTFLERNDVKEYLRLNVPKPWFEVRAQIKAPPLASVPGWCGCAFDYLLRFYVQKLNPFAKVRPWVAEDSVVILGHSSVYAATIQFPVVRFSFRPARRTLVAEYFSASSRASTAVSCAATSLSSPPTMAMTETDFGAESVMS